MHEVSAGEDVAMGADAVWAVIGDFGGIRKWAPVVESETVEEDAEGVWRTLTMPGGRVVRELRTDIGPYHYTYTLKRPDMKAYFSTVSVKPGTADSSRIALRVQFEPNTDPELEAVTEQLTKFCRGNLKAMKRALGLG